MISNDLYSWDPASLIWTNHSDFVQNDRPSPRFSHGLAAEGNLVFVFGGHNGSSPLNDLYAYNETAKYWKRYDPVVEMPAPRSCHGFTNALGNLYLFGGRTINGETFYSPVLMNNKCRDQFLCQARI